ncbi:MAG: MerR family transcriptional regulator [Clostridiales bacterium]|nr:MerR family transcriptional regulator [Clostridiales bacterium]
MRIKQVCDLTGFTDRAIRYYIEEELIAPQYTENYLGRKNFNFSQADVQCLHDIGVLRKFGFSIEEIKCIQKKPASVQDIISALIQEKRNTIDAQKEALDALQILPCDDMPLHELAMQLTIALQKAEIPSHNQTEKDAEAKCPQENPMRFSLWRCSLFVLLAVLPVIYLIQQMAWHATHERYATISGWGWPALILTLLPFGAMAWLGTRILCKRPKPDRKLIAWLISCCLFWQPLSIICASHIFGISETTDMAHYMQLDVGCNLHRYPPFELFPQIPGYSDRKYHYRHDANMGMYDVYAEWTLETEELMAEIDRAEALFASGKYGFHFDSGVQRVETEHFSCLFSVDPMRQTPGGEPSSPFHHTTKSHYSYVIFAWNEETGRVRYCVGDYFLGKHPVSPYYLSLDW